MQNTWDFPHGGLNWLTYWLKWVPSSTWSKAKELSELTLVSFCAKVIPSFASCQAWNWKTKLNFELTERSYNVENKVSLPTDSARAEMTFPRVVKLLLMLAPSFNLVPLAPVDSALSDPEKAWDFKHSTSSLKKLSINSGYITISATCLQDLPVKSCWLFRLSNLRPEKRKYNFSLHETLKWHEKLIGLGFGPCGKRC